MTITTGESDRSALESKDRQELATIAKAMGANPPARARKDELIDLILDLAENGGAGAPEEKSDGDAMSEQTTEDEATEATEAKAEPEADANGGEKAEKAEEKAADEKAADEKSEKAAQGEPRSNGSGRDRDQQQRGQGGQGGQRNQGQRGGGGGDDDEAEPGNRK